MSSLQIDIIPSHKIDKEKWNNCIDRSETPMVYPHTWYLDELADNWHGIVADDYSVVMPVPWRKKMGIRYCYDVPFIQQLGVYSTTDKIDNASLVKVFFKFVKYGNYNFNFGNHYIVDLARVQTVTNLIIDLIDKETITKNFTKSFKQSYDKSARYELTYVATTSAEVIEMFQNLYGDDLKNISVSEYRRFLHLTEKLKHQNKCEARKIIDPKGRTLSVILLLKHNKRLYNIMNATSSEGRKFESNYFLYSQVCQEFSGKGLLFDLEGSELAGVKNFYKKLGAVDQPYYRMHINKLPFPLKLFIS